MYLTADWSAAIEEQQLLDPWPDAYTPKWTPHEPAPPLIAWQKVLALEADEQVLPYECASNPARPHADERGH